MPRGKYTRNKKTQVENSPAENSPVVDLAIRIADMDPAGRALANEIAAKLVNERSKLTDVAHTPAAVGVLREVSVGEAISNGKAKAAPAKRAIKRAGKKHAAADTATPVKEKSSLAGFLGKGVKKSAPASD